MTLVEAHLGSETGWSWYPGLATRSHRLRLKTPINGHFLETDTDRGADGEFE